MLGAAAGARRLAAGVWTAAAGARRLAAGVWTAAAGVWTAAVGVRTAAAGAPCVFETASKAHRVFRAVNELIDFGGVN